MTPATVFKDLPVTYEEGNWPKNDNRKYQYARTVYQGVVSSINTIAVRTVDEIGHEYAYSFAKYNFGQNMQDTNFNISSTGLCLGATFHVSQVVDINAGYMHSFYNDHRIDRGNMIVDTYTRKNDAVGVSVDLKF